MTSAQSAYGGAPSMPAGGPIKQTPIGQPVTPTGAPSQWGPSLPTLGVGAGGDVTGTPQTQFNLGRNTGMDGLMGGPTPDYGIDRPMALRTPTSAPAPGGDPGGLDEEQIFNILNKLKPTDTPPPREVAPKPLDRIAAPEPAAQSASKSMGFARAKDKAGRLGNAALSALRSQMVSRGIEGSGVEGQLTANVLGDVASTTADAAYQQERAADEQAWDATQLGYQGDLSQRAGDQGVLGAGYSGGISQRGQDISAQPDMMALAPTILSLLKRQRY